MTGEDTSAAQDIAALITDMNEHWVAGQAEPIAEFLHENMVICAAEGTFRAEGREVCLQSIEDFCGAATILDFDADDPAIDVVGDTAVASYNFGIRYEMSDSEYEEAGTDVLVLNRGDAGWKIIWRMTNAHATEEV